MFAQYSPLFTSGLLSDSSPGSSRAPSPQPTRRRKVTHDSLPVTVKSASLSIYAPHTALGTSEDAFFLTLKPSRRQLDQGQSFLSLDLADAHRSMSLRRKDTVTTTHGWSAPTSPMSHMPSLPRPLIRRSSREGLPLPKPAPSTTLPEVPKRRRRPSTLTVSIPPSFPEAEAEPGPSSSTSTVFRHRATNSEPVALSPPLRSSPILSPSEYQSYFVFSPTVEMDMAVPTFSSPLLSTPPLTGSSEVATASSSVEPDSASPRIATVSTSLHTSLSCRSTASVATRTRNRSAALAALEGRSGMRKRVSVKRNFMSMSDDEDEDDSIEIEKQLGVLKEEEDDAVRSVEKLSPATSASKENKRESKRTSVSSESKRSRRSTIDSFLSPLTNFIDLRDDDGSSRSWRSFVELA